MLTEAFTNFFSEMFGVISIFVKSDSLRIFLIYSSELILIELSLFLYPSSICTSRMLETLFKLAIL